MKLSNRLFILLFLLTFVIGVQAKTKAPQRVIVSYVTSWTQVMPDPTVMTHINYAFGHVASTFDKVGVDNPRRDVLRYVLEAFRNKGQCAKGQTSNEKWQMMDRIFHIYENEEC